MNRLCFLFLIIAFPGLGQSVSIDSLRVQLAKASTVEKRVDVLNALSHAHTLISLDRAEEYGRLALSLAEEKSYEKGIAASYNNLGISASIRGDYTTGMDYFIKALHLREALNDIAGSSSVYNNMARVFIYQEDYDRAIEYSQKSLKLLEQANQPQAVGNAYIALGSIYISKKDYEQALKMFTTAENVYASARLNSQIQWARMKQVSALDALGKHKIALAKGLEVRAAVSVQADLFSVIELYEIMGTVYGNLNDFANAVMYFHRARSLADAGNDSNARISTRKNLSDLFRKFHQYDSAWYYNDQYVALRSEVFNAEKSRQLSSLEHLYQMEKKDEELTLREEKINVLVTVISIVSVLLLFITGLSIVVYRYYQDKKRSLVEMERLNR